MDDISISADELFHLTRLGMLGNVRQFAAMARRIARRLKRGGIAAGDSLLAIIAEEEREGQSVMRKVSRPDTTIPSDEGRLMFRLGQPVTGEPVLPDDIRSKVDQIVAEHTQQSMLAKAGLAPLRSALFLGAPGVGKTMTAHWIANRLNVPIYTLDLSHVSSSLLGKTGENIRNAFDFISRNQSVLLLDELDSIAKGRDQEDIGEAKRIVTVLLQQMDHLSAGSLVIGASNHGELLDRAIWRRFEMVIEFPSATLDTAQEVARQFLGGTESETTISIVAKIMNGRPISDISTLLQQSLKRKLLFDDSVLKTVLNSNFSIGHSGDKNSKRDLAKALIESGISQREASAITGLARETIRKIEI